jgi:predicted aldo/keto reductase-like oxidoreductase
MQYRKLGKTGIDISALGFGAMRLPMKDDHVEFESAVRAIQRSFELGVNFVDTAYMYCNDESQIAVGKALKGWRDKVYLSTKNHYKGESGAEWRKLLDISLERLDQEYIDFYNMHGLTWEQWSGPVTKKGGPFDEAVRARDEGLFRYFCLSCHDTPDNMKKLIDTGEFTSMILQYNLVDTTNEVAIDHAYEKGLGVFVMGPVAGGRLLEGAATVREVLGGVAASAPDLALRFVLDNPHVTCAMSGMGSIEMVEENCATASREEPLSDDERTRIRAMIEENKRLADLYCTNCKYCMPCSNDVDIPANFSLMNAYRVYGLEKWAKQTYSGMGKDNKKLPASECKECGECLDKCPQNIPIIDQLKEVAKTLGEE